jgi:hypothetical protein
MGNRTTEKDILMICKGHCDKEKYKNLEEALDAYYRKYYGVPKKQLPYLSHKFVYDLWLKECVREFLIPEKKEEFIWNVLIEESLKERDFLGKNCFGEEPVTDFYDVMYYRITKWLAMMKVKDHQGNWIIDLSGYEGNVI